jgi:coenzyme F420-reducing hydrogenase delta subunit
LLFEPRIIGFCCFNCAYSAADLAGSMRLAYAPAVRIVGVPCTGAVEDAVILAAFEEGADGVFVAGCLEGECHYRSGNIRARQRVQRLRRALQEMGLDGERLAMYNLSAAMGSRFAELANEFSRRIRLLGPSPVRKGGGGA